MSVLFVAEDGAVFAPSSLDVDETLVGGETGFLSGPGGGGGGIAANSSREDLEAAAEVAAALTMAAVDDKASNFTGWRGNLAAAAETEAVAAIDADEAATAAGNEVTA